MIYKGLLRNVVIMLTLFLNVDIGLASELDCNHPTTPTEELFCDNNRKADEEKNEQIFFAIVAFTVIGWVWNKFFRRRCPECKSTKYSIISKKELDRYRQAKEVTERTSNGRTKTRHIQVTYVINKYDFICDNCGKPWSEEIREEK